MEPSFASEIVNVTLSGLSDSPDENDESDAPLDAPKDAAKGQLIILKDLLIL